MNNFSPNYSFIILSIINNIPVILVLQDNTYYWSRNIPENISTFRYNFIVDGLEDVTNGNFLSLHNENIVNSNTNIINFNIDEFNIFQEYKLPYSIRELNDASRTDKMYFFPVELIYNQSDRAVTPYQSAYLWFCKNNRNLNICLQNNWFYPVNISTVPQTSENNNIFIFLLLIILVVVLSIGMIFIFANYDLHPTC